MRHCTLFINAFSVIIVVLLNLFISTKSLSQSTGNTNDEAQKIISDQEGIRAMAKPFNPNKLYLKDSWKGDWIWLNPVAYNEYQDTKTVWGTHPGYKKEYKALFRKSFELSKVPEQVIMSLTADLSFRAFINGQYVAQGPSNIGNDFFDGTPPTHWFFNTHHVKKYLRPGKNIIAIEVYSHFREISETTSGQGKMICDLEDGMHHSILRTDTTWKSAPDTSFHVLDGYFTQNANLNDPHWVDDDYDDTHWKPSGIVSASRPGYLVQSKIPVPFKYPIHPVGVFLPPNDSIAKDVESTVLNSAIHHIQFTLDHGRNMTGYYGFELDAHENDTIKILPFEKKYASQNRGLIYICRGGLNAFTAPYLSVYRYLRVEVISEKGLIIHSIHTDFSSYPIQYQGSFSCSDSSLTQLWDITRWTTQLCMNDMFYDSPKHQEPIACTGDYFIHSLINYYTFGDPWLTRQTLIKTAWMLEKNQYDMFHTSYSLLWVQMIHQYYQYTGDLQLVEEVLPHVNKLNQLFETYLDGDSLLSQAPDYMFMDWIKIDKFNAHHPPAVIGMGYLTAFYYKSLLDAAYLNRLVHQDITGGHDEELAQKIKSAINQWLWDPSKKIYKDGIPFRSNATNHRFFPKDENIVTYSPHINTLAVLYDIAPKKHQQSILEYAVHQKTIDLQPYFMMFVLSAVEHTHQFNTIGLELLKKWDNGYNKETHTLKENWQDQTETGYGGDYSHAWGGSPAYFMSKIILGVSPGAAGYNEIDLTPFPNEGITWAKGKVPLMNGQYLDVQWIKSGRLEYKYTLRIPEGNKVFLKIPEKYSNTSFTLNNIAYSKHTNRVLLVNGTNMLHFDKIIN